MHKKMVVWNIKMFKRKHSVSKIRVILKTSVPEIWYLDGNVNRRHYLDIYVKSKNKYIEVKSEWYYNRTKSR
jgi:hypothetical protein